FSFAHSVNWLSALERSESYQFEQNFVGIAPFFKSNDNNPPVADFRLGLGPLKYNQLEVEKIRRNIGGKIIKGVAATKKMFLANLHKGQILHLATHGKSNDHQGDFSYLAFAKPKQATDQQFLYVKDLFNLKIPADLVVLSACETGLGEIKKGEGIVGIGKGFSYAGAKSLVTTLWRVSDNSTANFMPIFYENLKEGLEKDEALWQAKRAFIQQYRNAAHPFFWSGYVAYGDMNAVDFQHSHYSYKWWMMLLGGIAGGGIFFKWRRFRNG
ncbi:MAG: CHAT domain-containing protein, partial [Bacteroidota bacterium]